VGVKAITDRGWYAMRWKHWACDGSMKRRAAPFTVNFHEALTDRFLARSRCDGMPLAAKG
jgi:hypothetical protein